MSALLSVQLLSRFTYFIKIKCLVKLSRQKKVGFVAFRNHMLKIVFCIDSAKLFRVQINVFLRVNAEPGI